MGDRANIKLKKDINTTIIVSIFFCVSSAIMGVLYTTEWIKFITFFCSGAFFLLFLNGLKNKRKFNKLGLDKYGHI